MRQEKETLQFIAKHDFALSRMKLLEANNESEPLSLLTGYIAETKSRLDVTAIKVKLRRSGFGKESIWT
ncbi:MAG TPA: hypothetical protein QF700_11265 [Prochlorococcus sp.]|nr:hypothetical protein [Prochlorococcus sp.]